MIEPPVDELAALFAAERAVPVSSEIVRSATRAKLAAVVGTAPVGSAAAGIASTSLLAGATGKVLAVLALAVGAGAGATHLMNDRSSNRVSTGGPSPSRESEIPSTAPISAPAPSAPSEASLLRAAWAETDPARALAIVQRDAQLHPDGPLAEERAVIEARALANLHRLPEARSAATRILLQHPGTVHRALVEQVLDGKVP